MPSDFFQLKIKNSRLILLLFLLSLLTTLQGEERTLRVMTYNIHHAEGQDAKVSPERIAQVILEAEADVVGLQEVDVGVTRTQQRDLIREISLLTGMAYVFGKNIDYQGGAYGNALLSRYPITASQNIHLKMLREGEQRGILKATLQVEERSLQFWVTHIDYRREDSERMANAEQFQGWFEQINCQPLILVGDFNDMPESRVYGKMTSFLTDAWKEVETNPGYTFSCIDPVRRIDYQFYSPLRGIRPVKAWIPKTEASDHLPLVVDYQFNR